MIFDHLGRTLGRSERILEFAHHRRAQLRKLHLSEERHDVQLEMLPVLINGGTLEVLCLAGFDP
jgi:hypothetical protein